MTKPDDRTDSELRRLLHGLEHWGSVESIARRARLPEAAVIAVFAALKDPVVGEEVCRNADAKEFLHDLGLRVTNARHNFVWEAIKVVGECGPPKGKGPNYERIYKDAQRDAQDALEKKFA